MSDAIFEQDGDYFIPSVNASSPWGPTLLHGAATAGLIGYAVEQAADTEKMQLARLTIDLFRPVPRDRLNFTTKVLRQGRKIQVIEVSLLCAEVEVCRAVAVLLIKNPIKVPAHGVPSLEKPEGPAGIKLHSFRAEAIGEIQKLPPGFHNVMEIRSTTNTFGGGKGTVWIKIPTRIIAGVDNTPLMIVAAISDLGNGMSQLRIDDDTGIINADISMHLYRMPESEWICLDAETKVATTGVGIVETKLFDESGLIGMVNQACLASPVYKGA
ncbi:MAG: thioesterase family protein [Pseudomonadales bacterium]|nr:thioesterase family protein [Pseudomonadales bacterium]